MTSPDVPDAELESALRLLVGRRVALLTGAGMSTESGIPDYRSPGAKPRRPVQHADFLRSEAVRKRYWARALFGWERFIEAAPNEGHLAVARWEASGRFLGTITQNVDRLHQRAGSREVIELHGALEEVVCLSCRAIEPRSALQRRLQELNRELGDGLAEMAPDGDAEVQQTVIDHFRLASCSYCQGVLKPNVVFFGDNVPKPTVEAAFAWVDQAEALVVLGSSLQVFSGFRFVRRAHERGVPIVIVNQGPTRGDPLASLRVEGRLGAVLPPLVERLAG